ncbi:prepilin-type N-terminal cleavage/methylation domain-containing protein [candidate division KSB1 bacterium]|nr:prepilin-type N-terminal cleavage/methylation domain-containing protein [candidate division KSB1 bacterium]
MIWTMVMNRIRSKLAEQTGMTIIEIIISLLIISVLSGTILVQFKHTAESAKIAACVSNQAALQTAVNIYYAQYKGYPHQIEDIVPNLVSEEMPECPSGGTYLLVGRDDIQCTLEDHQ